MREENRNRKGETNSQKQKEMDRQKKDRKREIHKTDAVKEVGSGGEDCKITRDSCL